MPTFDDRDLRARINSVIAETHRLTAQTHEYLEFVRPGNERIRAGMEGVAPKHGRREADVSTPRP